MKPIVSSLYISGLAIGLSSLCPSAGAAVPGAENGLSAALSASTEYTDNALSRPGNELEERNDQVGLSVLGQWTGPWLNAQINYHVEQNTFSKGSQEDETTKEGNASMTLWQSAPVSFSASHSSRRVLNDAADTRTLANTDERDVTSANLSFRLSPSTNDTLQITPSWTQVRYKNNDTSNSDRPGVTFDWNHQLSPISSTGITLSENDVQFDDSSRDYTYQRAALFYGKQLRQLSYNLQAGYNKNKPENRDSTEGPFIQVDAAYDGGLHGFNASLSKRLTDTSLGDGNQGAIDTLNSTLGGNQDFDEYELTEARFGYSYANICQNCLLDLGLTYKDEDHTLFSENDTSEYAFSAGLSYRLSTMASLGFSSTFRSTSFDQRPDADFDEQNYRITLKRKMSERMSLNFATEWEERSSDLSSSDYDRWIATLGLDYRLYP